MAGPKSIPMDTPVLGGILVADKVIDLLLPVLFYLVRHCRWKKLHTADPQQEVSQQTERTSSEPETAIPHQEIISTQSVRAVLPIMWIR